MLYRLYSLEGFKHVEDQQRIERLTKWTAQTCSVDGKPGGPKKGMWSQNPVRSPPPPQTGTIWWSGWWHGILRSGWAPGSNRPVASMFFGTVALPVHKYYRPCLTIDGEIRLCRYGPCQWTGQVRVWRRKLNQRTGHTWLSGYRNWPWAFWVDKQPLS